MNIFNLIKTLQIICGLGLIFLRSAEYGSVFGYYFFDLNLNLKNSIEKLFEYFIGIDNENI